MRSRVHAEIMSGYDSIEMRLFAPLAVASALDTPLFEPLSGPLTPLKGRECLLGRISWVRDPNGCDGACWLPQSTIGIEEIDHVETQDKYMAALYLMMMDKPLIQAIHINLRGKVIVCRPDWVHVAVGPDMSGWDYCKLCTKQGKSLRAIHFHCMSKGHIRRVIHAGRGCTPPCFLSEHPKCLQVSIDQPQPDDIWIIGCFHPPVPEAPPATLGSPLFIVNEEEKEEKEEDCQWYQDGRGRFYKLTLLAQPVEVSEDQLPEEIRTAFEDGYGPQLQLSDIRSGS